MKDYSVEQALSLAELVKKVNEQLAAGRELVGGICVVGKPDAMTFSKYEYLQAMVYSPKRRQPYVPPEEE